MIKDLELVECTSCHKKLRAKSFRQVGQHGDANRRRNTVCYACEVETEKKLLQEAMAKRKEARRQRILAREEARKERREKEEAKRAELEAAREAKKDAVRRAKQLEKDTKDPAKEQEAIAKRELASRELAKRRLLHYVERNVPGYEAGWVHEDICRRLERFVEDVEQKKSPRLMLWVPPRHGKSEIASVNFPSWVLGKHPDWEIISASYSADLPLDFSRTIRAKIQSDEYRALFPFTQLAKDFQGAERWRTPQRGGYRAAGVAGGITGMGAHILIIDDPVKDAEEADSETSREKAWKWFGSTAYTRLAPGGGVLVIQTRWHDDDLSGRLERVMNEGLKEYAEQAREAKEALSGAVTDEERSEAGRMMQELSELKQSIDRWEIVKYPAIATANEYLNLETGRITTGVSDKTAKGHKQRYKLLRKQGDALHHARFPLRTLRKYKRTLQPRHWSALYQQDPVPDEGAFFTRDMFRFVPEVPLWSDMHCLVAWDLAVGLKASNDWTVGVVGALDWNGDLYILDMVRGRWRSIEIAEAIVSTHLKYGALQTGIEKGQLELALRPFLDKVIRERKASVALAEGKEALVPITDKVVRARPLQGLMQQGRVVLPQNQPWTETIMHEMLRFPSGVWDDIVDGMSWLARMALRTGVPADPATKKRDYSKLGSWKDRLKGQLGNKKHFMAA